jgi:hypothetical protein
VTRQTLRVTLQTLRLRRSCSLCCVESTCRRSHTRTAPQSSRPGPSETRPCDCGPVSKEQRKPHNSGRGQATQ